MPSFTNLGVGLGGNINVNELIKASVDMARLPITRSTGLTYQATMIDAKISTYGQIKSLVSTLSDAASKLASVTGWNAVTATSSNKDAITASAVGGTVASTLSVEVQGLAKAQTMTSQALGKGLPVGAGTLRLEVGKWADPSTFTPADDKKAVDIVVGANDTLSSIAGKINGAKAGVTATIVSDASGERLLLRSQSTGEEAGFRMTVTDTDGNDADGSGLSRLMDNVATSYAEDAKATVNGIAVTSATNTFSNAVSGVTFNALKVTTGPVEITVASDTSKVRENLDAFVKAYNAVNQALNTITSYDKETKTAGLLQGDSTAVSLQNTLRMALQSVAGGGDGKLRTLSDVGIGTAKGTDPLRPTGDLELDAVKLNAALKDPEALKTFFRGADGNAANGVGTKIKATLDSLLADGTGFFSSKDKVLQKAKTANSKDVRAVEDRATRLEANLTARYVALDSQMSRLNALNAYIAQQVTTWNKTPG